MCNGRCARSGAQICLFFDETGPKWRLLNVEDELKLKYSSHLASIDPEPKPTLVSMLSMFGSIHPPLPPGCFDTGDSSLKGNYFFR